MRKSRMCLLCLYSNLTSLVNVTYMNCIHYHYINVAQHTLNGIVTNLYLALEENWKFSIVNITYIYNLIYHANH